MHGVGSSSHVPRGAKTRHRRDCTCQLNFLAQVTGVNFPSTVRSWLDQMSDHQAELPDRVSKSRIQAIFPAPNITVHPRNEGERPLPSHGTWRRTETPIGHGGYGSVFLEEKLWNGLPTTQLRAVKFLALEPAQLRTTRKYVRELLALVTFSSESKVGKANPILSC